MNIRWLALTQGQFIQKSVISKNVLNLEAGVRCILLYFEEKQNTNYFDQSEAVKAPINLLMYRSFRNYSDTKIHCFYIYILHKHVCKEHSANFTA